MGEYLKFNEWLFMNKDFYVIWYIKIDNQEVTANCYAFSNLTESNKIRQLQFYILITIYQLKKKDASHHYFRYSMNV